MIRNHIQENVAVEILDLMTYSIGGAIYATGNLSMTAINNLIVQNDARAGCAMYIIPYFEHNAVGRFYHNTVADNICDPDVGAIYLKPDVELLFINNIISGHSRGVQNDAWTVSTFLGDTNLYWNDVDGDISDLYGIYGAPKYAMNYHLQNASPAFDAALHPMFYSYHPALTTDLDSISRPQGAGPDVGAYEGGWYIVNLPVLYKK